MLDDKIAAEIADLLVRNGYSTCSPEDVWDVSRYGSVNQSTVSDEYDEALTDQIIAALDARGIEVAS